MALHKTRRIGVIQGTQTKNKTWKGCLLPVLQIGQETRTFHAACGSTACHQVIDGNHLHVMRAEMGRSLADH